ncbi:isochorismate synthase [Ekhidna sp.]|uniref:isochorismate synthase n=1 Tax=Ekhidna sp. TaxID=2608089 RepID=UPI003B512486
MKELKTILKLETPDILINQLKEAEYSFAVWKKPDEDEIHTFISLRESKQIDSPRLNDLDTGFLFNTYSDNHPIRPFYINADLIIKSNEISIAPGVSDSQIDEFKERIKSTKNDRPNKIIESNDASNRFESSVSKALTEIENGTFEKVVLSRYRDATLPESFSIWSFFQTICDKYVNAFCSIAHIPGKGIWIGATPELLISNNQDQFKTVSLAGTKSLSNGQPLNEIAWTQKEIEEQAMVSRYVINCFKKIRLREFHEHGPKTIKAGNLAHLKTEFIVNYNEVNFEELADQMLELLHPTSAVCGMPIDQTKPWIEKEEQYDREFYSGFLGPVNVDNSSDLYVNLRCMKVSDGMVRFFAGAGITEDSDPHKEYEETEMKIDVLKSNLH